MKKRGRPTKFTPQLQAEIAEMFFLAFTDEQIALYCGVGVRSLRRIREGKLWPDVKKGQISREKTYRKKIWDGGAGWCGAAWFLERLYPSKFAAPQIQLQVDARAYTQHNATIIIASDVAQNIMQRTREVDERLDKFFEGKTPRKLPPPLPSQNGAGGVETQNGDKDP